jgi:hypothetical protein
VPRWTRWFDDCRCNPPTQAGEASEGHPLPSGVSRGALALVGAHLGEGVSIKRLARRLGLTGPTLTQWCCLRSRPVLRPVTLTPEPGPTVRPWGGAVLTNQQGHRVENLNLAGLIDVLRDLT